ncbi:MAG TPA: BrxA/BrxB family bacilliredoxin [Pyrinomonadaceae bacterium]|jgi:putative YphP/YqiW family bacilliredoxin|nr:BrxA/BrxB family bacilliredoxin [Pyrinomonadaceae bacterium]
MPYSEILIKPMREDLTNVGVEETRTPAEVEDAIKNTKGTLLVVVNSVCGCAAGRARPGVAMALQNEARPDRSITVFAGADMEATATARAHFAPYPPSSPQIALFKDGQLVYMLERHQIENKFADQIADELSQAFQRFCAPASTATA